MSALRKYVAVGLIGAVVLAASGTAMAQATLLATTTPETFRLTITKFEMFPKGESYSTLAQGGLAFDLAKIAAGDISGFFLQDVTIRPVDYVNGRITFACGLIFKGSVTYQGTTYYTTSSGGTSTSQANFAEGPLDICSGQSAFQLEVFPGNTTTVILCVPPLVNVNFRTTANVTNSLGLFDVQGVKTLMPSSASFAMTPDCCTSCQ